MPLTLESLTDADVAAIQRQSDVDGVPLEHWVRNTLLRAVRPDVLAQIRPSSSAIEDTLRGTDAVDALLEDERDPDPADTVREGGSVLFGVPPAPSVTTEVHARTRGGALGTGPIATTEQVTSHPCRHLLRAIPPGFTANDCQGTCSHPGRNGSVCTWPANVARNCHAFSGKVLPRPPPASMPRQG